MNNNKIQFYQMHLLCKAVLQVIQPVLQLVCLKPADRDLSHRNRTFSRISYNMARCLPWTFAALCD